MLTRSCLPKKERLAGGAANGASFYSAAQAPMAPWPMASLGGDLHPPVFQVPQQVAPVVGAFANAVDQAEHILVAARSHTK